MRTSQKKMNRVLKTQITNTFMEAIIELSDVPEAQKVLSSFFTKTELTTFVKRLAIAYWLKKKRSYANIKENLKVSSATIATVSEMMRDDGFKLIIKKMEAQEFANIWDKRIREFVGKSSE